MRQKTRGQFVPNPYGLTREDFQDAIGEPEERVRQALKARNRREEAEMMLDEKQPYF